MPKTKQAKPTSSREWLLKRIEAYLVQAQIDAETFGWVAVRDSSLVGRLRAGKDVTTRKMDAIIAYMAKPTINKGE